MRETSMPRGSRARGRACRCPARCAGWRTGACAASCTGSAGSARVSVAWTAAAAAARGPKQRLRLPRCLRGRAFAGCGRVSRRQRDRAAVCGGPRGGSRTVHAAQRNAGGPADRARKREREHTDSSLESMSVSSLSALAHMWRCCDAAEVERAGDVSNEKLIVGHATADKRHSSANSAVGSSRCSQQNQGG